MYLTSTPLIKKGSKFNLGSKTVSKNDLLSGSNIEGNSKSKYRIQNTKSKRALKGRERNQKEEMNFYAQNKPSLVTIYNLEFYFSISMQFA